MILNPDCWIKHNPCYCIFCTRLSVRCCHLCTSLHLCQIWCSSYYFVYLCSSTMKSVFLYISVIDEAWWCYPCIFYIFVTDCAYRELDILYYTSLSKLMTSLHFCIPLWVMMLTLYLVHLCQWWCLIWILYNSISDDAYTVFCTSLPVTMLTLYFVHLCQWWYLLCILYISASDDV